MIEQVLSNRGSDESLFSSAIDYMFSGEMVYALYLLKRILRKDDLVSYNIALCLYSLELYQDAYDELRIIKERSISGFDFSFLPPHILEKTSIGFPPFRNGTDESLFALLLIRLKFELSRKLGLESECRRLSACLPGRSPWNLY